MNKQYPFTRFVLPNGLTVLHYKMDSVMSACAVLYIKTGAVYEKPDERGISHFLEHQSFLGTKKYPTPLKLAQISQNLGLIKDGRTSGSNVFYWIKLPNLNFKTGLDILYELVFKQLFDNKSLLSERSVIVSEFNDFWHNPERRFFHEIYRKRFKQETHPYSYRPLGTPPTINNIDKKKVISWKNKYFHPKNMVLSVAGNIEVEVLKKYLGKTFGKEAPGEKMEEPKFSTNDYSNFLTYCQADPRPQITFYFSFPAFGRIKHSRHERIALTLLNHILGRSSASRLFQRLRDKERYVYKIFSDISLMLYMGDLYISGSTPFDKLLQAVRVFKEEVDFLTKKGVTEKEINAAKNFISAQTLMQFDNPGSIAEYFVNQELNEKEIWFPEDYIGEYEKITKQDLDKMAKEIFDYSKLNIGLLGNVPEKIEKEIEKIFHNNA